MKGVIYFIMLLLLSSCKTTVYKYEYFGDGVQDDFYLTRKNDKHSILSTKFSETHKIVFDKTIKILTDDTSFTYLSEVDSVTLDTSLGVDEEGFMSSFPLIEYCQRGVSNNIQSRFWKKFTYKISDEDGSFGFYVDSDTSLLRIHLLPYKDINIPFIKDSAINVLVGNSSGFIYVISYSSYYPISNCFNEFKISCTGFKEFNWISRRRLTKVLFP